MSKIKDMKNILSAYRLCRYLRQNGKLHVCKEDKCNLLGKISVNKIELFEKVLTKGEITGRVNEYILVTDLYDEKYFRTAVCHENRKAYLYLTNDGTDLTDNLLLPYTPKNLWLEIWKGNKVLLTGIYLIVVTTFGVSITGILIGLLKIFRWLVSNV